MDLTTLFKSLGLATALTPGGAAATALPITDAEVPLAPIVSQAPTLEAGGEAALEAATPTPALEAPSVTPVPFVADAEEESDEDEWLEDQALEDQALEDGPNGEATPARGRSAEAHARRDARRAERLRGPERAAQVRRAERATGPERAVLARAEAQARRAERVTGPEHAALARAEAQARRAERGPAHD